MSAYNLLYLRNRIKLKLQNDDLYADADVNDSINESIDDLVIFTEYLRNQISYNSAIGVREVQLTGATLMVHDVTYAGLMLTEMTLLEFLQGGGGDATAQGTPGKFYFRYDDTGFYIGFDMLPDSVQPIVVFSTTKPTELVNDTDVPVVPRQFAKSIIHAVIADKLEEDVTASDANTMARIDHHRQLATEFRAEAEIYFKANEKRKVRRTRRN